ncbi:MAG: hypothetical protein ABIO67_12360 [Mycobacteriales bacterium]
MGRTVAPLSRRGVAVLLVALAALVAAFGLFSSNDVVSPEAGSVTRLTYAVEDLVAAARTTEVVQLEGPLRSRQVTDFGGSATDERAVYQRVGDSWREVAAVLPGEVGAQQHAAAALRWAEGQRLARRDGVGSFLGRTCTWWLTREPLDLGAVAPATDADRARSCVNPDGLLFADTWRAGGRDLRTRSLTDYAHQTGLALLDGRSPGPLPSALITTVVSERTEPRSDLVVPVPPPGLALLLAAGSIDVVPGSTEQVRRTERAIYASSGNLLVLDQIRGAYDSRGSDVVLPGLGTARIQATLGGLVVSVRLAPDQYLRVRSSLPYDATFGWLSGLQRPATKFGK